MRVSYPKQHGTSTHALVQDMASTHALVQDMASTHALVQDMSLAEKREYQWNLQNLKYEEHR
jgi:hypothetical protein